MGEIEDAGRAIDQRKPKGDQGIDELLILSQVILSLQLAFAIVPLIHFTSDRRKMGEFATPAIVKGLAWIAATIIIVLNIQMVYQEIVTPYTTGTSSLYALNTWGTRMTKAAPMMEPSTEARPPMMTATKRLMDSMKVNILGSK